MDPLCVYCANESALRQTGLVQTQSRVPPEPSRGAEQPWTDETDDFHGIRMQRCFAERMGHT